MNGFTNMEFFFTLTPPLKLPACIRNFSEGLLSLLLAKNDFISALNLFKGTGVDGQGASEETSASSASNFNG
jgi:uncharacterized protein YcgI (DUF1989 family)